MRAMTKCQRWRLCWYHLHQLLENETVRMKHEKENLVAMTGIAKTKAKKEMFCANSSSECNGGRMVFGVTKAFPSLPCALLGVL